MEIIGSAEHCSFDTFQGPILVIRCRRLAGVKCPGERPPNRPPIVRLIAWCAGD